ncbi:MAG: DUF4344 domain-containing metallopeptidase [Micropepsaceae bacterium]
MKRFVPVLAATVLFALPAPAFAQDDTTVTDAEAGAMVDEIDAAEDDGNGPYRQAYEKAAKALAAAYPDLPPEEVERITLYILGNTVNTLFHEYGHGLVSELGLPIVAREEDAVDNLANIIMVAKTSDPALDSMLRAVADDYFTNGRFSEDNGEEASPWDEHSPDKARAYDVICTLVGADPESYKEAADNAGMPAERQEACAGEYEQKLEAWDKLLGPYYLKEGETNKKVTVTYGKPSEATATMAAFIKDSGIMQVVTDEITAMVKLPNDIHAEVTACDDSNAYWSPDDRKLTLCYEIVQSYYDNAAGGAASPE